MASNERGVTVFAFPGNEPLAATIAGALGATAVPITVDHFPDGEARVQLGERCSGGDAVIVCALEHADQKILPLVFAAATARELGAARVGLVAPYLAYMRQDRRFHEGEAVSAVHFASLVSRAVDWMVTVEPHLHRIATLSEIYSIPTEVVHVGCEIAAWVSRHVADGVVIGPDAESRQWVRAVADVAGLPYIVLRKTRISGERVEVSVPDMAPWRDRTPILVDDVIATGHTMMEAARHLRDAGARSPVCVAVHAVFAGDAYGALLSAGFERIVTTTTIPHQSNAIDVSSRVATSTIAMLERADVTRTLPAGQLPAQSRSRRL
jgi:ribose-phosphate pyrophosphokinase